MEEEINTIKKENQMLKQLLKQDKNKIDYWVDIAEELEEWLEAMARIYEDEYKDIDAAEHYKCVLKQLKELQGNK